VDPGVDISGPDIAAIARGFGVPSTRVNAGDGIADAVRHAQKLAAGSPETQGPALVEIITSTAARIHPSTPDF
jgi:thiamine pyrophosphate-dependent acetolactate synthase large subunit-like protein